MSINVIMLHLGLTAFYFLRLLIQFIIRGNNTFGMGLWYGTVVWYGIFVPYHIPYHRTIPGFHLISSQSLNLGGRRGTTDDVATISFHPSLSSAALRESPNPILVHSFMLSSHLFFCLPLLLAPFTVPCRIVFAMPEDLEMWPYHLSFRFFTMVRRSSCTPIAFWILLRTSSFVTWSL